jgi:hypothetical protein
MAEPQPGAIVVYDGERRVVVDVVDYRDEDDGGAQDVFCVLRRTDDDPLRRTDDEGGDVDIWSAPASGCEVIGHI